MSGELKTAARQAADRIRSAWGRLTLGSGLLLHGLGGWLSPGGCGPLLLRSAGTVAALAFGGSLLGRAPHLAYAVPVVWAATAWHLSDSSATPPPRGVGPSAGVSADEAAKSARAVMDPNGVMCITHLAREEVNGE